MEVKYEIMTKKLNLFPDWNIEYTIRSIGTYLGIYEKKYFFL